jgi:hypothetical protein
MDGLTKRNHSNPCFWTAYWDTTYYESRVAGRDPETEARRTPVFALNVKANKIIPTVVDDVHFDKGMGQDTISPEAMRGFCKRHFPDQYEKFCQDIADRPESLGIDFESVFSGLEGTPAYTTLQTVIRQGDLAGPWDKANIACFIVMQQIRSHAILTSNIEAFRLIGIEKWEYLWMLKRCIGNPDSLLRLVSPVANAQWIIHCTDSHTFPLPDTPVLVNSGRMMVALSPRMLVEVNLGVRTSEEQWITRRGIHKSKLREYRRRAISNTFKELIFHDQEVLHCWQETPEFRKRVALISDAKSYNALVDLDGKQQILCINALGNAL